MIFRNRTDAGKQLAQRLHTYANCRDTIVLGLPRGGVPVAFEVATTLQAPLDVLVVRKLGVPGRKELAMGAIASGGVCYLNSQLVSELAISPASIERVRQAEQAELDRREKAYRDDLPPLDLCDRTVILVDDGLATGATMFAAVKALQQQALTRLVVAVPIASPITCQEFESEVDQIICAETPRTFRAVGMWYKNFAQTTDQEVKDLLKQAQLTRIPKSEVNTSQTA